MECCTPEKAEVLAITARLGWEDADLTVGKLFRLWRWFDQHTESGNAAGVTSALLDRVVGVSGFCDALTQVGWLLISDSGISLPNFDRHNGNTAKNRAQTAKRVAKHKSNVKANAEGNAQIVSDELPREEKRREEKSVSSLRSETRRAPDETEPQPEVFEPSVAAKVCLALRKAGIASVNPSSPELLALVESGATQAEFTEAAFTSAKKGKLNFSYVLGVVRGRREDAAKMSGSLHQGPMPAQAPAIQAESFRERDQRKTAEKLSVLAPGVVDRSLLPVEQPRTIFVEEIRNVPAIESN